MIDSESKRRAVLGVLPTPDASVDAPDRRQLLHCYPFESLIAYTADFHFLTTSIFAPGFLAHSILTPGFRALQIFTPGFQTAALE